jgi:hypothetical protein
LEVWEDAVYICVAKSGFNVFNNIILQNTGLSRSVSFSSLSLDLAALWASQP